MPLGIIGATGICTILYIIMCIVICMMVPYADIDTGAPFSSAFGYVGLAWAKCVPACLISMPDFVHTDDNETEDCPLFTCSCIKATRSGCALHVHCRALLHPCEPLAMSRLGQVDCSTMYALCAFDASLDRITVFITGKLMLLGCNNVQI